MQARAAAAIAKCRAIIGGEFDPFGPVWDAMLPEKRRFWLHYSGQGGRLSGKLWRELPGDARCRIKAQIYRGAAEMVHLVKHFEAGAAS